MSTAEYYAQGLESLAAWVRANAEHLEADGVDLRESVSIPIVTPSVWAELRESLGGDDATRPESGYVVMAREFGPIDVRLGTTAEIDAAADELRPAVTEARR